VAAIHALQRQSISLSFEFYRFVFFAGSGWIVAHGEVTAESLFGGYFSVGGHSAGTQLMVAKMHVDA